MLVSWWLLGCLCRFFFFLLTHSRVLCVLRTYTTVVCVCLWMSLLPAIIATRPLPLQATRIIAVSLERTGGASASSQMPIACVCVCLFLLTGSLSPLLTYFLVDTASAFVLMSLTVSLWHTISEVSC